MPDPLPVSPEEMREQKFHNMFVEIRGTVRKVGIIPEFRNLRLEISTPHDILEVLVPNFDGKDTAIPKQWLNQPAILRGVLSGRGNNLRQQYELRLHVPSLENVSVTPGLLDAEFFKPRKPIEALMRFDPARSEKSPVNIRGTATLQLPGRGIYLQQDGAGVWVQSFQYGNFPPGSPVAALGVLGLESGRVILRDAILRPAAHSPPRSPYP